MNKHMEKFEKIMNVECISTVVYNIMCKYKPPVNNDLLIK